MDERKYRSSIGRLIVTMQGSTERLAPLGQGSRLLRVPQRLGRWTTSRGSFWTYVSLHAAGYLALFLTLHLRSIGWAPGQILEPFAGYWSLFFHVVASEEAVMTARRSHAADPYMPWLIGALAFLGASFAATMYRLRSLEEHEAPGRRALFGAALLLCIPLLLLPNLLSGDIYSYISFGRIAAIHGGNPFTEPPISYPRDTYYHWVDWKDVPSVYGPTWIYLSMLLTVVIETIHGSVTTYVLSYKLLATLLHLLNGALIWAILERSRPQQRVWGTALYLLNPLPMIEFVGSGHNDALMIALILAAVLAHLRGYWLGAVTLFALAALTKWIALPLLPLYGLALLRRNVTWSRRAQYLGGAFAVCIGLTIGLYLPYWEGPETLAVLLEAPPQSRFVNSLGQVVVDELQYGMFLLGRWPHPALANFSPLAMRAPQPRSSGLLEEQGWRAQQRAALLRYNAIQVTKRLEVDARRKAIQHAVRTVALMLVFVACLAGAFVTRNIGTMLMAGAWIFFVYTTLGAPWVWPWYATWFVALAALLDWRVTGRSALLLSALFPLIYPLYQWTPTATLPQRFRAVLVLGPPVLFAGYHLLRLARSSWRGERSFGEMAWDE